MISAAAVAKSVPVSLYAEKKAKSNSRKKLPGSSNPSVPPLASRMQGEVEEVLLVSADDDGEKTGGDGGRYLLYHSSCTAITQHLVHLLNSL